MNSYFESQRTTKMFLLEQYIPIFLMVYPFLFYHNTPTLFQDNKSVFLVNSTCDFITDEINENNCTLSMQTVIIYINYLFDILRC